MCTSSTVIIYRNVQFHLQCILYNFTYTKNISSHTFFTEQCTASAAPDWASVMSTNCPLDRATTTGRERSSRTQGGPPTGMANMRGTIHVWQRTGWLRDDLAAGKPSQQLLLHVAHSNFPSTWHRSTTAAGDSSAEQIPGYPQVGGSSWPAAFFQPEPLTLIKEFYFYGVAGR